MAIAASPLFTIATSDNNASVGSVSFRVAVLADYAVPEGALTIAIMGVVNGVKKEQGVYDRQIDDLRLIGPNTSDKGHKWRVTYRDIVTGRLESKTIPTANPLLRKPASDAMDTAAPAYTALKNAIETHVQSSVGNDVLLESVVYEG